ncbi:MAG: protein-tyrosine phosphatase family protein [Anaerolineae bacterium]
MDQIVFQRHQRLESLPPVKLLYIIYRRLVEQGLLSTGQWVVEKVARRLQGFSPAWASCVYPGLYVGGQQSRHGLERMRATGIGAVVNLREESDDAARGVAPEHYLWLPTEDDAPPRLEDLERGVAFIEAQRAAERGVYVHCASGVGRAPTMAAAYLVSRGMTPQEAWATIHRVRPFIRPTPPQLEIIEIFARQQAGEDPA